jgi:hypothetical protein
VRSNVVELEDVLKSEVGEGKNRATLYLRLGVRGTHP